MEPAPKPPGIERRLENLGQQRFGRSRITCIKEGICIKCGEPAKEFKDEASRREFTLSALCQPCQDKVFG